MVLSLFRLLISWKILHTQLWSWDIKVFMHSWLIIRAKNLGNDHLIEFHLMEIVFYQLIKIFIISWPKFLRLFTWLKFLIMSLIKRLKISQLIEKFDQLPKKNWQILAVDRNFKITKNDIYKISINCHKRTDGFWHLI